MRNQPPRQLKSVTSVRRQCVAPWVSQRNSSGCQRLSVALGEFLHGQQRYQVPTAALCRIPIQYFMCQRASLQSPAHAPPHEVRIHFSRDEGPRIRSVLVSSRAGLLRTAYKTKRNGIEWNRQLHSLASECLPISTWRKGVLSPSCIHDVGALICCIQTHVYTYTYIYIYIYICC